MIYVEEATACPALNLKAQAVVVTGKGKGDINAEKFAVQGHANVTGKVKAIDITKIGELECELVVSASLTTGL